jgi:hypothetical protein
LQIADDALPTINLTSLRSDIRRIRSLRDMIAGKEGIYLRRVEDVLYMNGIGQTCFRSIELIAPCLSLQNLEDKTGFQS